MKRSFLFGLITSLLVSSALIFYKFVHIPTQLAFDEVEFAKIALSLSSQPYTPYVTTAYGHSTPYFYVILLSIKLLGLSTFALRLPAAIFGIASCLLFYAIMARVFKNNFFALWGALLLATQRWFYTFARYSFEATFLVFLELGGILSLVVFLQKKKWYHLVVTAIFSGLAFHSYYPGRIFFLLPLFALAVTKNFKQIAVFLGIFLVTISPLLFYFQSHPDNRINQLFILSNPRFTSSQKVNQIGENIKRNVLHLYINHGDMNGRHNYPGKAALNPVIGMLATLGLVIAVRKRKEILNKVFLGFAFLSFIPPILVPSAENPNMLRSFPLLVPLSYFSTLTLRALYQKLKIKNAYKVLLILLMIIGAALYDGRTYFRYQSGVFKESFEVTCPLTTVLPMNPQTLGEIPLRCRTHRSSDRPL